MQCTLILVEKEKKGHSYSSSRHPVLTEDKKAKIKVFTKEYTHKILKKLKERGKLRKSLSNGHGKGPTPSLDRHHSTSSSHGGRNNDSTPSATPVSFSTPSNILETPERNGSSADLVSDIFGLDDQDDVDMDASASVIEASPLGVSTPDNEMSPLDMKRTTSISVNPKQMYRQPEPPAFTEIQPSNLAIPGTPDSGGEVKERDML